MRILYIFPHPDDESFGPAAAISHQARTGHEVYLLTLTRGGATKERFKYNYSIERMGKARYAEMQEVAKVLKLADLTVLDFPDSGLKEADPRKVENVVRTHIQKVDPQVVVTYPVHGISGFADHLVAHHVVKRVFLELKGSRNLQRLAFYTLTRQAAEQGQHHRLSFSTAEDIDCVMEVDEQDVQLLKDALGCYKTYQDMIEKTGVKNLATKQVYFEIFQEDRKPPLSDLFSGLRIRSKLNLATSALNGSPLWNLTPSRKYISTVVSLRTLESRASIGSNFMSPSRR